MKYKAIIFDVGDTLIEHSPSQQQIYVDRLKYLGFNVDENTAKSIENAISKASHEQIIKEQNGAPRMADKDFEAMLDKAALGCVNADNEKYLEALSNTPVPEQKLQIIPGTIEVLQSLQSMGYRLAIVSNHRTWLPDYLAEIGLSPFFETIVVSEIVGVEKPDVRIMKIALENLSLDAECCLYVGDHPLDVLCSKNAGIACAWLTAPNSVLPESVPYCEDYRIQSLQDLLHVV